MKTQRMLPAALVLLALVVPPAGASSFDADLLALQQDWAKANYDAVDDDARERAFEALEARAEAFSKANPGRAEALIWEAIIESSWAGAKGGLGALGLAKEARGNLEAALSIDPTALDGSAYTSLGTLYYKVPGFPLGFGDDDKARDLLQKALKLNPDGIDPNYFYGEFLYEEGEYRQALQYLERAAQAADRPGRERADHGRRAEVAALAAKAKAERG